MNMKRIFSAAFAVLLIFSITSNVLASGVYYLPRVTSEMSVSSYWTDETEILMSYDEIEKLNRCIKKH